MRADRTRRTRANLRVSNDEREKLRVELYQNSLLPFEQGTDAENVILQLKSTNVGEVDALCRLYDFPIGDEQELQHALSHILARPSQATVNPRAWCFSQFYLLRNATLAVYHNCRRLQEAGLVGAWFSMLVLENPSNDRIRVINLNRVNIEDIGELVTQLSLTVTALQDRYTQDLNLFQGFRILDRLSEKVHLVYKKIFQRLGLDGYFSHDLYSFGDLRQFDDIRRFDFALWHYLIAQWWCATGALDAGIVAYANGHVFNFEETTRINLGVFKPRANDQMPEHSKSLQYMRRGLNCLAAFFQEHDVWVLAMEEVSNGLYLASDIETFADVWGPVWRVLDKFRPGLVAKYNVRGGSIVPWPSDPNIHLKLRSNERLCHWKSNAEYIQHRDADSANFGMSSILASWSVNISHSG